jgi:carbonic anhydrase
MHIKDIYRYHKNEIDALPTEEQRINRLVELNILEQVQTLAHTSIIQNAWHHDQRPVLHGWVYGMSDGLLIPLITLYPDTDIDPIYKYDY